jgi:hypothetical protein
MASRPWPCANREVIPGLFPSARTGRWPTSAKPSLAVVWKLNTVVLECRSNEICHHHLIIRALGFTDGEVYGRLSVRLARRPHPPERPVAEVRNAEAPAEPAEPGLAFGAGGRTFCSP